jgi:hypothetical protein
LETIPLIENAEERDNAAAIPVSTAAKEPLAVETLEDRVLPASDAVPAAPSAVVPRAEPAPYVAAQQTPHSAIDLETVADMADAGADVQQTPGASAAQSTASHPAHGEAELVENKFETFEKAVPENRVFNEAETNRNEFGLATIEPETGASDVLKASRDRSSFKTLVEQDSERGESGAGNVTSRSEAPDREMDPAAVQVAVQEVADELNTGLVETSGIAPRVESATALVASGTVAEALRAGERSDLLVQTVLKAEPGTPTVTAQEVEPNADEAEFVAQEPTLREPSSGVAADADKAALDVQPQQRQQGHRDIPADTASAAHDALFEGGSGVEVVLAPPSNA